MKTLGKGLLTVWLLSCLVPMWLGIALFGMVAAFTEYSFLYYVSPFVSYTLAFGIFYNIYKMWRKS